MKIINFHKIFKQLLIVTFLVFIINQTLIISKRSKSSFKKTSGKSLGYKHDINFDSNIFFESLKKPLPTEVKSHKKIIENVTLKCSKTQANSNANYPDVCLVNKINYLKEITKNFDQDFGKCQVKFCECNDRLREILVIISQISMSICTNQVSEKVVFVKDIKNVVRLIHTYTEILLKNKIDFKFLEPLLKVNI